MYTQRWISLIATLSFACLLVISHSAKAFTAEHRRTGSISPSAAIKGTWYSAKETLTFNANGTIIYKGRRYYYAVSTGGTIQLTGKHGSLTFPYQLAGGKLTLTVSGKATVYTRRR